MPARGRSGPAPKPAAKRERRNVDPHPPVELTDAPTDAPALPMAENYSERTLVWFATWASSPQASQFIATDWERLFALAPLIDEFYRRPTPALFSAIVRGEQGLGATPEDRLRLRWRMADGKHDDDRVAKTATKTK